MNPRILDLLDAVHARLHRWRWRVRLVLAIVLVPWFAHFAYVRMTTLPADPDWDAKVVDRYWNPALPAGHPTTVLAELVKQLPALQVPEPTTAPPGMQWVTAYGKIANLAIPRESYYINWRHHALAGEWSPHVRYMQGRAAAHIASPEVMEKLDRIAALVDESFVWSWPMPGDGWSVLNDCAEMLCARARCTLAETGDLEAAMADLGAIYRLTESVLRRGTLGDCTVALSCRWLVAEEVRCWCRELRLSRRDARVLVEMLSTYRLDMPRQWNRAMGKECEFVECQLDRTYTRGPGGNGWFVMYPRRSGGLTDTVLSGANLLSVFVSDRRAAMRRCAAITRRAILPEGLSWPEAASRLPEHAGSPTSRDPFYDPVPTHGGCLDRYKTFLRDLAGTDATIVSAALSAWRTEHGAYPARLAALVPEYLDSLPLDPISGEPLRYRLDDVDGYSLYGVGADGVDDGGCLRNGSCSDWGYDGLRSKPADEWYLRAAQQDADGDVASED